MPRSCRSSGCSSRAARSAPRCRCRRSSRSMTRRCCTRPRRPGSASGCCRSSCAGRDLRPGASRRCSPSGACRRRLRSMRSTPRRSNPIRACSSSWIFSPPTSSPRSHCPPRRAGLPPVTRPRTPRALAATSRTPRYPQTPGDTDPTRKRLSEMYRAPVREVRFVLEELLQARSLAASPALSDYSDELAQSVLEEAARFAEGVLDPLNRTGDIEGVRWTADGVLTAPGFRAAYQKFVAGGWPALGAPPQFGGQPVPQVLSTAVAEFWGSANLAFKLCPMLTIGAVHALELCGTPTQKKTFLPKMVSGEWTGTMVLTEPQAGSDLGQVRTRAVPEGDHYRLFGQKIFITWGDHDLTANTIHMVLGRIEGAAAGVKGISLFIVPKWQVLPDGSLGERNDVRCLSI